MTANGSCAIDGWLSMTLVHQDPARATWQAPSLRVMISDCRGSRRRIPSAINSLSSSTITADHSGISHFFLFISDCFLFICFPFQIYVTDPSFYCAELVFLHLVSGRREEGGKGEREGGGIPVQPRHRRRRRRLLLRQQLQRSWGPSVKTCERGQHQGRHRRSH
jgi:hypothetical protein